MVYGYFYGTINMWNKSITKIHIYIRDSSFITFTAANSPDERTAAWK